MNLENNNDAVIKNRIFYADITRVFATILVLFLHIIARYIYEFSNSSRWWTLNILDSFTRIAVPLFLCLSGSLLLSKNFQEPALTFYKRRINKILFPLLAWSVIYFLYSNGLTIAIPQIILFIKSFLSGTIYFHLPFMYYLIGIYLLIPILRIYTNVAIKRDLELFMIIWVTSEFVIKILPLFGINISGSLVMLTGFIGFPVLGHYATIYSKPSKKYILFFLINWLITIIGTYLLSNKSMQLNEHLYQYTAPNVIIMTYIFFSWIKNTSYQNTFLYKKDKGKFIELLSKSTFTVYFIHPLILTFLFNIGKQFCPVIINSIRSIPITLVILVITTFTLSILIDNIKVVFKKKKI